MSKPSVADPHQTPISDKPMRFPSPNHTHSHRRLLHAGVSTPNPSQRWTLTDPNERDTPRAG